MKFINKGTYVEVIDYDDRLSERRLLNEAAESFYHRVEMQAGAEVHNHNIFLGDSPKPAFTVRRDASGLIIEVNSVEAKGLLRKICD